MSDDGIPFVGRQRPAVRATGGRLVPASARERPAAPAAPTHRTTREITLHYGAGGSRALPAGTLVTILSEHSGVVRFTYAGCSTDYAVATRARFEPLEIRPAGDVASET